MSRLNNDVIGAQRAFSDTLSGVVSNIVTLTLTLGVMIYISWQITLLASSCCRSSWSRRVGWDAGWLLSLGRPRSTTRACRPR